MQLVQEKAQKYNENGYKLASVICRQFLTDETHIYYDTEQGRFVNNLDEYMLQLNNGMIKPYASTVEEHESAISLYSTISDPSKKCSNIFGHKWGYWSNWVETETIHHHPDGLCVLRMVRIRKCERTYCGATQTETDGVFITSCH